MGTSSVMPLWGGQPLTEQLCGDPNLCRSPRAQLATHIWSSCLKLSAVMAPKTRLNRRSQDQSRPSLLKKLWRVNHPKFEPNLTTEAANCHSPWQMGLPKLGRSRTPDPAPAAVWHDTPRAETNLFGWKLYKICKLYNMKICQNFGIKTEICSTSHSFLQNHFNSKDLCEWKGSSVTDQRLGHYFWSCYVILVHILSRRTVRKHLKHLRSGTHPLHFTHVTASARALSWGSPWEGCTHSPPKKSDQPMHKPLPGKWSAPLIHHGSRLACRICCKDKWVNHWESLIHPNPTKGWLLEPWKNCYGKKVESGTCQKAVSSFQKKSPNMLLGCVDTARPYAWHHALRQDLERSSHAGAVLQRARRKARSPTPGPSSVCAACGPGWIVNNS